LDKAVAYTKGGGTKFGGPHVIFTIHSVFIPVGCMEHSESQSDFEPQEVHVGLDGLPDEPSKTSSGTRH
jgi:hypothetical protein